MCPPNTTLSQKALGAKNDLRTSATHAPTARQPSERRLRYEKIPSVGYKDVEKHDVDVMEDGFPSTLLASLLFPLIFFSPFPSALLSSFNNLFSNCSFLSYPFLFFPSTSLPFPTVPFSMTSSFPLPSPPFPSQPTPT